MKKNFSTQQNTPVHTRPVSQHTPTTPTVEERWIITHDSRKEQRSPITEVYHGSIEQWIADNNKTLFVLNAIRIR